MNQGFHAVCQHVSLLVGRCRRSPDPYASSLAHKLLFLCFVINTPNGLNNYHSFPFLVGRAGENANVRM